MMGTLRRFEDEILLAQDDIPAAKALFGGWMDELRQRPEQGCSRSVTSTGT